MSMWAVLRRWWLWAALAAFAGVVEGAAVMPTLLLPAPGPGTLDFDARNVTSEMLAVNVPTAADDERCRGDARLLARAALAATPWALRMYDASTKVPDGLLAGNVVQLGNFDECLATQASRSTIRTTALDTLATQRTGGFWGKYCLAGISVRRAEAREAGEEAEGDEDEDEDAEDEDGPPGRDRDRFSRRLLRALLGRRLQWAVCMPATCGASDLEHHLQHSMEQLLRTREGGFTLNASVLQSNCYTAHAIQLDAADWAVTILLAWILAIVVTSTAYDLTHPDASKGCLAAAFSVQRSWRALVAMGPAGSGGKGKEQLASVNAVKVLSMAWVMLFHKYCVMLETPNVNSDVVLEGLKYDWTQMPVSNGGTMAVNSFFVAGGLLLAHGFLRERVAGRSFNLFTFYAHRYARLTPVYAVTVAVYATLLFHAGSGPLWNPVMAMHRENCRAHWWRNLLFVNNYQPVTSELCVVQSWYLAADMQLFLLSPLVLWPLWRLRRRPRLQVALLALLLLVPLASTFTITFTRKYPWADAKELSAEIRNSYFPLVHASAYARAAPFLVGLGLAWALHATPKGAARLPKALVALCWALVAAVSWTVVYALFIYYRKDHAYSELEAAAFQALHPLGWGLAVAWTIYACERGYAGPVGALLRWRGWAPLARLSYAAYLLHFAVFYVGLGATRAPGSFSHAAVARELLGDVCVVMALSVAAALALELPMMRVTTALLRPRAPVAGPTETVTAPGTAPEIREVTVGGVVNAAFQGEPPGVTNHITKM